MLDDDNISEDLRARILSLMYVMYEHGIVDVHMGGLMRILGVPNEDCAEWDDKVMCLDEDFAKYMQEIQTLPDIPSQLLH